MKRSKKLLRALSFVLLQTFIAQQFSYADVLVPLVAKQELQPKPEVGLKFPQSVASIEDAWLSEEHLRQKAGGQKINDTRIVYLLQDAHTNESGQYNLAKALGLILGKEKDLRYVFTEAGVGDNSLSSTKPLSELQKISKEYIRKGLLHGEEYLQLTSDRIFTLWGVEDLELYRRAVEDYRQVARERERFDLYLKKIEATIETLKDRFLNPSLQTFDKERKAYREDKLALTSYFTALWREANLQNISLEPYPHLSLLKSLKKKEESLDFAKANSEHVKAIEGLSKEVQAELKEITDASQNKADKVMGQGQKETQAYFLVLEEKLSASNYPELSKYFEYLKLAKGVEAKEVLKEIESLENAILASLSRSEDEKGLLKCENVLFSLKKLFHFALTPEEYASYKAETRDFTIEHLTGFLNKKIMDLEVYYDRSLFLEKGYDEVLKRAESFYELTKTRDEHFLQSALEKMDKESAKKAVLVTGGFHTTNLKALLKEKGISFVSVTPQVWQATNMKKYESLLLGQTFKTVGTMARPSTSMARLLELRTAEMIGNPGARLALEALGAGFPTTSLSPSSSTLSANKGARLSTESDRLPWLKKEKMRNHKDTLEILENQQRDREKRGIGRERDKDSAIEYHKRKLRQNKTGARLAAEKSLLTRIAISVLAVAVVGGVGLMGYRYFSDEALSPAQSRPSVISIPVTEPSFSLNNHGHFEFTQKFAEPIVLDSGDKIILELNGAPEGVRQYASISVNTANGKVYLTNMAETNNGRMVIEPRSWRFRFDTSEHTSVSFPLVMTGLNVQLPVYRDLLQNPEFLRQQISRLSVKSMQLVKSPSGARLASATEQILADPEFKRLVAEGKRQGAPAPDTVLNAANTAARRLGLPEYSGVDEDGRLIPATNRNEAPTNLGTRLAAEAKAPMNEWTNAHKIEQTLSEMSREGVFQSVNIKLSEELPWWMSLAQLFDEAMVDDRGYSDGFYSADLNVDSSFSTLLRLALRRTRYSQYRIKLDPENEGRIILEYKPSLRTKFFGDYLSKPEGRAEGARLSEAGDVRSIYFFGEGQTEGNASMNKILGGKGANLAEMANLGLPVPPGFTITTAETKKYFKNNNQFPDGLWAAVESNLSRLETLRGKKLGDAINPLLVSVRSGAEVSMPGMMDTILNVGLNDQSVEGLASHSGNPRFAYDSYRRLLQMFGETAMGVEKSVLTSVFDDYKKSKGFGLDDDNKLDAEDMKALIPLLKDAILKETGREFPQDPKEQLRLAIEAVFRSSNNEHANVYRRVNGIAQDVVSAVNIQSMVFGNYGDDSATGVAFTRDTSSGENRFNGEFLINAQGEDVVAGIRKGSLLDVLKTVMPDAHALLLHYGALLETHARNAQDLEFTIEDGKFYMLQTRNAKRTAAAMVRMAVEMAEEGMISKEEALLRIDLTRIEKELMHPMVDPKAAKKATKIATGVDASPGAAVGQVVFTSETAENWHAQGKKIILVRPETSPDDLAGMVVSQGILTAQGGSTSHAALVARGQGIPAVVGVGALDIHVQEKYIQVGSHTIREGDWLTMDGSSGKVYLGQVKTVESEIEQVQNGQMDAKDSLIYQNYATLLGWADEIRRLEVWANADQPEDAKKARALGAQGIGLTRSEHMFAKTERVPVVQSMFLSVEGSESRNKILSEIEIMQQGDFEGILEAMDGLPVTIRLLDPPINEFLPKEEDPNFSDRVNDIAGRLNISREEVLKRIEKMHEGNPMLGNRGVRLLLTNESILRMQARSMTAAHVNLVKRGIKAPLKIMVPNVSVLEEFVRAKEIILEEMNKALDAQGLKREDVDIAIGTMIETPSAALTSDELAKVADFFSYGTNDLTQGTFMFDRDGAAKTFLTTYLETGIFMHDPTKRLDSKAVFRLVDISMKEARAIKTGLLCGVCGEHGGEPESIALFDKAGLDYVSASPMRLPIARLAAAQATLKQQASGARLAVQRFGGRVNTGDELVTLLMTLNQLAVTGTQLDVTFTVQLAEGAVFEAARIKQFDADRAILMEVDGMERWFGVEGFTERSRLAAGEEIISVISALSIQTASGARLAADLIEVYNPSRRPLQMTFSQGLKLVQAALKSKGREAELSVSIGSTHDFVRALSIRLSDLPDRILADVPPVQKTLLAGVLQNDGQTLIDDAEPSKAVFVLQQQDTSRENKGVLILVVPQDGKPINLGMQTVTNNEFVWMLKSAARAGDSATGARLAYDYQNTLNGLDSNYVSDDFIRVYTTLLEKRGVTAGDILSFNQWLFKLSDIELKRLITENPPAEKTGKIVVPVGTEKPVVVTYDLTAGDIKLEYTRSTFFPAIYEKIAEAMEPWIVLEAITTYTAQIQTARQTGSRLSFQDAIVEAMAQAAIPMRFSLENLKAELWNYNPIGAIQYFNNEFSIRYEQTYREALSKNLKNRQASESIERIHNGSLEADIKNILDPAYVAFTKPNAKASDYITVLMNLSSRYSAAIDALTSQVVVRSASLEVRNGWVSGLPEDASPTGARLATNLFTISDLKPQAIRDVEGLKGYLGVRNNIQAESMVYMKIQTRGETLQGLVTRANETEFTVRSKGKMLETNSFDLVESMMDVYSFSVAQNVVETNPDALKLLLSEVIARVEARQRVLPTDLGQVNFQIDELTRLLEEKSLEIANGGKTEWDDVVMQSYQGQLGELQAQREVLMASSAGARLATNKETAAANKILAEAKSLLPAVTSQDPETYNQARARINAIVGNGDSYQVAMEMMRLIREGKMDERYIQLAAVIGLPYPYEAALALAREATNDSNIILPLDATIVVAQRAAENESNPLPLTAAFAIADAVGNNPTVVTPEVLRDILERLQGTISNETQVMVDTAESWSPRSQAQLELVRGSIEKIERVLAVNGVNAGARLSVIAQRLATIAQNIDRYNNHINNALTDVSLRLTAIADLLTSGQTNNPNLVRDAIKDLQDIQGFLAGESAYDTFTTDISGVIQSLQAPSSDPSRLGARLAIGTYQKMEFSENSIITFNGLFRPVANTLWMVLSEIHMPVKSAFTLRDIQDFYGKNDLMGDQYDLIRALTPEDARKILSYIAFGEDRKGQEFDDSFASLSEEEAYIVSMIDFVFGDISGFEADAVSFRQLKKKFESNLTSDLDDDATEDDKSFIKPQYHDRLITRALEVFATAGLIEVTNTASTGARLSESSLSTGLENRKVFMPQAQETISLEASRRVLVTVERPMPGISTVSGLYLGERLVPVGQLDASDIESWLNVIGLPSSERPLRFSDQAPQGAVPYEGVLLWVTEQTDAAQSDTYAVDPRDFEDISNLEYKINSMIAAVSGARLAANPAPQLKIIIEKMNWLTAKNRPGGHSDTIVAAYLLEDARRILSLNQDLTTDQRHLNLLVNVISRRDQDDLFYPKVANTVLTVLERDKRINLSDDQLVLLKDILARETKKERFLAPAGESFREMVLAIEELALERKEMIASADRADGARLASVPNTPLTAKGVVDKAVEWAGRGPIVLYDLSGNRLLTIANESNRNFVEFSLAKAMEEYYGLTYDWTHNKYINYPNYFRHFTGSESNGEFSIRQVAGSGARLADRQFLESTLGVSGLSRLRQAGLGLALIASSLLIPVAHANQTVLNTQEHEITVQLEGLEKYGLRVAGDTLLVRQGSLTQSFPLDQLTRDSQGQAVSAQVSISDIVNGERASDEAVRRAGALITNLNTARDVIQVWDPSLFVPEDAGFSTAHFDIFTSKVLTAAAHNPHTFVMLDPNGDPQLLKVAGARLAELSQQKPSIAAKLSRIFVTTALAATLVAGGAVRVHANPSDVAVTPVAGDRYIPIQRMSADEFPNHPTELLNITGQMELKDGQPLDPHYVDTYSIAKGGENINIEHSKLKRVVEGSAPVSERKEYGIWPRFKTALQYIQQAARNLLAVGSSA